jgi:dCMP deaminase
MEDLELKKAIKKIKPLENKLKPLANSPDKTKEAESEKYKRPSWDEYFLEMARIVGTRGTCDRGRNGAVIVKNKRILTSGYVGAPMGLPHCDEVGHLLHDVINPDGKITKHCIRTVHAEQNAIIQAALHGVSTDGATLYAKFEPCFDCAKMIVNAGIKRVVCQKKYHAGELTRNLFKEAGIELVFIEDEVEEYPDQ